MTNYNTFNLLNENITPSTTQLIYSNFRIDCGLDTISCLEFLRWLHDETNTLHHLRDMKDLTMFEKNFIEQILNE